jgi:hypothetical protein
VPDCRSSGEVRPRLEVADVVRSHGSAYRQQYAPSPEQARTLRAIANCRTAALGGHTDVCNHCGHERPAYNSCRNRHCPKCQAMAQEAWLEARKARLLETHYFHVVFTLPQELRPLALNNRRLVFDLLFEAAAQTLLELARDAKRLGALPGFTAVLHTWTRALSFHPHLHVIVTGGGLSVDHHWKSVRGGRFLFPVKVLSRLFRGKFLAGLVRARQAGHLRYTGTCADLTEDDIFDALKDGLYRKEWVVYAKRPFGGAEKVYRYLGRYTHRVGLSNNRLQAIDGAGVRFATKDGKNVTLAPLEFLRRFLLHVLPQGFVKIRHYGLLAAANVKTKLPLARQASGLGPPPRDDAPILTIDWRQRLLVLTGLDLIRCPLCRVGAMLRHPLLPPRARSPTAHVLVT